MRTEPIKEPRRVGSHLAYAHVLLVELGASNIRFYKTKHIAAVFNVGPHELTVRLCSTPRNNDDAMNHFRQQLTREVRKALARVA